MHYVIREVYMRGEDALPANAFTPEYGRADTVLDNALRVCLALEGDRLFIHLG